MKILLVTARYLPHRGGLESVVQHLAQEFLKKGHQVQIVTNRYPCFLPALEVVDGVKVIRLIFLLPEVKFLKNFRFDLWLAGLWYRFSTLRALHAVLQEFQPDIINNHYLNEVAEFTGRCLSDCCKSTPWVISLHGGDVDGEPFLGNRRMKRFCKAVQQASFLTVCSNHLAEQALGLEPSIVNKTKVIHNGVDMETFSLAHPFSFSVPYVLAVGQLVWHKGFDVLVESFAQVATKYPRVNLLIAGEGEYLPDLESLIESMEINHRISLIGKVDSPKVASLMAGSLFVALPSRREPFGIVALEAMASGKCVLSTPVGGIPEFLPCPPNKMVSLDVAAWAQALDSWLDKAAHDQLDGHANQSVAEKHTWQFVADQYMRIFRQALE